MKGASQDRGRPESRESLCYTHIAETRDSAKHVKTPTANATSRFKSLSARRAECVPSLRDSHRQTNRQTRPPGDHGRARRDAAREHGR